MALVMYIFQHTSVSFPKDTHIAGQLLNNNKNKWKSLRKFHLSPGINQNVFSFQSQSVSLSIT